MLLYFQSLSKFDEINYRNVVTQNVNDRADFTTEQHELTVVIAIDTSLAQYGTNMYQRPEITIEWQKYIPVTGSQIRIFA